MRPGGWGGIFLGGLVCLAGGAGAEDALGVLRVGGDAGAGRVTVVVTDAEGRGGWRGAVWVADTPAARRRGLSGRRTLAAEEGMLFVFSPPRAGVCFWMKETFVPLRALFAEADGRVVRVVRMVPESTEPHCAPDGVPVRYVLEVLDEGG